MMKLLTAQLYGMFLRCDWWINLSRLKRSLAGKCERCGCKRKLQSHHRRYPENWFDTKLSDLEVLCRDCHENEHHISHAVFTPNNRQQRHEFRKLRAKLLKVRKNRHRGAFK